MGCHSICEHCKYYLECENKGKSLFGPCRLKDETPRPPHISYLKPKKEGTSTCKHLIPHCYKDCNLFKQPCNDVDDCPIKELQQLKKENEVLKEAVEYCNMYKCDKCGHYTMYGYVCHWCGTDRTLNNEDL